MLPRLISLPKESSTELFRAKTIHDLPDVLLAEILCRLPCNKLIFRCKLVSKPWYSLISAPYFVGRYLRLQHQMQKPIVTTLFLFDVSKKPICLITTSDHPLFKTAASNFTLSFLPCYNRAKYIEEIDPLGYPDLRSTCMQPGSIVLPVVVGTYNDLVLCCATMSYQCHYYLCNPYTKQWVPLPPTPQVYCDASVAFVCDPYYKYSSDHHNEEEAENNTSTTITRNTSSFILKDEYKWKVVRLVPNSSDPNFHFEIFYSETRQWREIYVACSRPFSSFARSLHSYKYSITTSSITYKGMLYWWSDNGLVLELDLSKPNTIVYRFIEAPEDFRAPNSSTLGLLGVSEGRLQLCLHSDWMYHDQYLDEGLQSFRVRDLKQVVKDNQGNLKWLSNRVAIDCKDIEVPIPNPNTTQVLAFLPNNENVVYLAACGRIYTCNFRGETLEKTTETRVGHIRKFYYPFSLPWWPTPVPRTLEYLGYN